MKHFSYTKNEKYGAIPETSMTPEDVENIQEFETLELLQASPEYIAQIALQNDGFNQDEVNWMASRDEILNSAYVHYKGFIVDMSQKSRDNLLRKADYLERNNKKFKHQVKRISDDKVMRVDVGRSDINALFDAYFAAEEIIEEAADTGFPVNPWPLAVS